MAEVNKPAVAFAAGDEVLAKRGSGPTATAEMVALSGVAWGGNVRDGLTALSGAARLPATAIRDLPVEAVTIWGNGPPESGTGKDNDTYIDATNVALYGPKAGGAWPVTPLDIGGGDVASVAGKTGVVTLEKADVGLGSVDNTADTAKPVSTATQAALDLKADAADLAALTIEDIGDVTAAGLALTTAATPEAQVAALGLTAHVIPEGKVAIGGSDGKPVYLTIAELLASLRSVEQVSYADVSGSFVLSYDPTVTKYHRALTGDATASDFIGFPESGGPWQVTIEQDTTARTLAWNPEKIAVSGDVDPHEEAGSLTYYWIDNQPGVGMIVWQDVNRAGVVEPATGLQVSDFTVVGGTLEATANGVKLSGSWPAMAVWNGSAPDNGVMRMRFRRLGPITTPTTQYFGAAVRASKPDAYYDGYPMAVRAFSGNMGDVRMMEFWPSPETPTTQPQLKVTFDPADESNDYLTEWVWIEARANGTTIEVKTWLDGGTEPGTYQSFTDATYATGGYAVWALEMDPTAALEVAEFTVTAL